MHFVPLDANLGHDLAAMDARITNAVKLVFVCNPNNPTGTLADSAKLRDFVLSVSTRALVIVDEAYHDFVDEPSYRSMTDLATKGANVIISRTASKIHGIAGLRVGFAIARPDIINRLRPLRTGSPNAFGMNAFGDCVAAGHRISGFREGAKQGRTGFADVDAQGIGQACGAFADELRFFHADMPVARVQTAMLSKGYRIGRAFPPYNDWCRISIGTPDEMKGCVAALPEALRA